MDDIKRKEKCRRKRQVEGYKAYFLDKTEFSDHTSE